MKGNKLLTQIRQADPLCKAPLVELLGDYRAVIENHLGVLAYASEEISIKTKCGNILVQGDNMCLCELSRDQLVIAGNIYSVRLIRR